MGVPEDQVQTASDKYKAHFPEWRLDSFPGFLGNVTAGRGGSLKMISRFGGVM